MGGQRAPKSGTFSSGLAVLRERDHCGGQPLNIYGIPQASSVASSSVAAMINDLYTVLGSRNPNT